jgi:hypothetical protein
VDTWLQNNRPKQEGKKGKKPYVGDGRMTWNLRKVVQKLMKDDITALHESRAANLAPGSKERLALYPACWTEVVDGLSKEKKQEFEALADKWNRDGVDESLRPE